MEATLRLVSDEEAVACATRETRIIRHWRGGLPYNVTVWACRWERYQYEIRDPEGGVIGTSALAAGVKHPWQCARAMLKRLNGAGKLRSCPDSEAAARLGDTARPSLEVR